VKKSSQIQPMGATALPEQVTVAMSEIAENMQEGLLALAVGAGLQVMQALMDADVTELAGPKGRHDEARTAVRARPRTRVGDPGRKTGAGDPPAGAGRRRLRGVGDRVV
jgi:putative transposase